MSEDDTPLARWSRRKRRAAEAARAEPAPPVAEIAEAAASEPATDDAAMTEAEIAALPPVDTITRPQDLAVFLRRGAPAVLRQAALRRMWRINPAIRDYVDDAREYAFDWNAPGGAPGGGMLSQDAAAKVLARLFPASGSPAPVADAAAGPPPPEPPAQPLSEGAGGLVAGAEPGVASDAAAAAPAAAPPPLRRHGGATPT